MQGVFYRASTKKKADELGIKGFVQNEADGSVYIEAEGEEEVMYKFIKWCNQGPAGAQVLKVDVQTSSAKNFISFDIKR